MLNATKKELLNIAKTLGIVGRHDMTRDDLAAAVDTVQGNDEQDAQVNGEENGEDTTTKDHVLELKRRTASTAERGEDGKVIRLGRNLSGNVPYRRKFYYVDRDAYEAAGEAVEAAPNQVKLILKYMVECDVDAPMHAKQGGTIVEDAILATYLQTKISPASLFAYYRRLLETLGVTEV